MIPLLWQAVEVYDVYADSVTPKKELCFEDTC